MCETCCQPCVNKACCRRPERSFWLLHFARSILWQGSSILASGLGPETYACSKALQLCCTKGFDGDLFAWCSELSRPGNQKSMLQLYCAPSLYFGRTVAHGSPAVLFAGIFFCPHLPDKQPMNPSLVVCGCPAGRRLGCSFACTSSSSPLTLGVPPAVPMEGIVHHKGYAMP